MRLTRSPNIIAYWKGGQFVVEEFVRRKRITAIPLVATLLDTFDRARSIDEVARSFPPYRPTSVGREIRRLRRLGFLVPAAERGAEGDVSNAWRGCFAAGYYHFATGNVRYAADEAGRMRYIQERLQTGPPPPAFKNYSTRPWVPLPKRHRARADDALLAVLRQRRTVREFSRRSVSFADFAHIIAGTWGRTKMVDAGLLGNVILKTSPSAGARHPIECYLLVWNVEGIASGLYHYSVRRNGLERLLDGDFRRRAVQIAAGQKWIGQAAFLCVMTAVADRVFWKYPSSDAYRLFFLDAGHLAQTFALLATSRGLGAFTTAAMNESAVQTALRLDGIREFPVYLCGAGSPRERAAIGAAAGGSLL